MLKPGEVKSRLTTDEKEIEIVDNLFDKAIKRAESTGDWPAVVPVTRGSINKDALNIVAKRFRSVGWSVILYILYPTNPPFPRQQSIASIQHPDLNGPEPEEPDPDE